MIINRVNKEKYKTNKGNELTIPPWLQLKRTFTTGYREDTTPQFKYQVSLLRILRATYPVDSSHTVFSQVWVKHPFIPYLECHMAHSSRNKCQIPWVGWRGHAFCHSFQWGQTATDKNYSETGLHDGWSIILPKGNPHKSECEFVRGENVESFHL